MKDSTGVEILEGAKLHFDLDRTGVVRYDDYHKSWVIDCDDSRTLSLSKLLKKYTVIHFYDSGGADCSRNKLYDLLNLA